MAVVVEVVGVEAVVEDLEEVVLVEAVEEAEVVDVVATTDKMIDRTGDQDHIRADTNAFVITRLS